MNVYQAVSEVAKAVGPVYKDRAAQGYAYRGIEDFMNALSGPLRDVGLVIVPHVDRVEHFDEPQGKKPGWVRVMLEVTYLVAGPEGDSFQARVSADALDNSDKAHGKAMSYAYKTLVGQLFCIPTEEDNEQHGASDHDGERGRDPKVDAVLDDAREAFKALDKSDQAQVTGAFKSEFGISLKEIETLKEAKGLAELIADVPAEESDSDVEMARELLDGLSKVELAEWAKFAEAENIDPGNPEAWNDRDIEVAFEWLQTEDN